MGNYYDAVADILSRRDYPMSYLSDKFCDVDEWQGAARREVRRLLAFDPPDVPLDAAVHDTYVKDGLIYQHVSYAMQYGPRTEGILMRPANAPTNAAENAATNAAENAVGKLPGVVALHDHGGFKYYGKEKITNPKNQPEIMAGFQEEYYEGRAWAAELARRGYIVFVPDMFLWGSRKMQIGGVTGEYVKDVTNKPVDSTEHILAYNEFTSAHEHLIAKTLIEAGTTWPGMMLYDDMRAVDFLLTQPQVDAANIGCGGLSGGGLRTVFLAAMDGRVKCSAGVGFMSTAGEFALHKVQTHTWMMYLPGLTNLMDFPDLYSLHGKKPAMILYDEDDELFTPKGMHDADERLRRIYGKMGAPELYSGHFFPGPHKFDAEMQEAAFAFYDKWMKP